MPRPWLDAVAAAGGVAVPAALGYEADDAVAALVAWVSSFLRPAAHFVARCLQSSNRSFCIHWLRVAVISQTMVCVSIAVNATKHCAVVVLAPCVCLCLQCEQQAPAPLVLLVSADADLWQLTSPTTFWLQLARGPTRACPAGLALNSAAGFQQHHGYPPGLHGDVLALIGKPEAGVPGAGVSKRACKQLLLR